MPSNNAFHLLLLASRLAAAAYIPLAQPVERDADEGYDAQPEQIVTEIRVVTEDIAAATSPTFTYDPISSYTYDPLPSYTYDPIPSYTYDLPVKRELVERDNGTLSHPAPNSTAIPSAFKTTPFSRIVITSLLDPDSPAPQNTTGPSSRTTPLSRVSSTSTLESSSHPAPSPTAIPSAFKTTPLSSISITFTLDPDSPAPSDTTGSSSVHRTTSRSKSSTTSTLDSTSHPAPNPTAIPSAFRTTPLSSLSITFTLDPNGPAPPLTTLTTTTRKTSTTRKNVAIAAALASMISFDHQDTAPSLLPIAALPSTTSTIPILLTTASSSVPGALGGRPLTPTLVSGGIAYVPAFVTTDVDSGYVSSKTVPTTAFQFVSPGRLFTWTPPSVIVDVTLTGKGGTEGGWSVFTRTLATGVASSGLVTRSGLDYGESLLVFISVGHGSMTSDGSAKQTMAQSMIADTTSSGSKTASAATGTEHVFSITEPSSTKKQLATLASTSTCTSNEDHTTPSPTSKQPAKTTSSPSSSSRLTTPTTFTSTKPTTAEPIPRTSPSSSSIPDEMIGKGKGSQSTGKKGWSGDIRCVYPYPGCDDYP